MHEDAEWASLDPLDEVDRCDPDPHPPEVTGVDGSVQSGRLRSGAAHEALHVVIATDHAVERNDIGRRNLVGDIDEIAVHELHSVAVSSPLGLFACHREMSLRCIDVYRPDRAPVEELVVYRTDTRSDVEEYGAAVIERRTQGVDEEPRGLIRPAATELPELLPGRGIPELLLDPDALSARHCYSSARVAPTGGRAASRVSFAMHTARATLVRRGLWLNVGTIAYNSLEAIISLVAGVMAGSVALVGFGVDSVIEVTASGAAHWRLRADWDAARRERVERATLRVIGATFLGLAAYVASDAVVALVHGERPDESPVGIVIAALSLVVMPLLARAKRRVALAMGSGALVAEARQTSLCAYLSAILLGGLALNALLGWWWADPVAALAMVPIIAKEGVDGLRGRATSCDACAATERVA